MVKDGEEILICERKGCNNFFKESQGRYVIGYHINVCSEQCEEILINRLASKDVDPEFLTTTFHTL